jgi:hypothetical protein
MKGSACDLRARLIEVVAFMDPPSRVNDVIRVIIYCCHLHFIFVTFLFDIVFILSLPYKNCTILADSVDLSADITSLMPTDSYSN